MKKLIIEHINSKIDFNGNVYWLAVYTDTKTGESITVTTPHESNSESVARAAGYEWKEIHSIRNKELPIREFNRLAKRVDKHNTCKDQWLIDLLAGWKKTTNKRG